MRASHTQGPWKVLHAKLRPQFPVLITEVQDAAGNAVVAWAGFDGVPQKKDEMLANASLIAAAPDLLEVSRIEQELQMRGYTRATATRLGREAEDAFLAAGVPGLNNWRRKKREAAIAKAQERP